MTAKPLAVRPIPATEPHTISADEAYAARVTPTQDALALDFRADPDDDFERRPTVRRHLDDPAPCTASSRAF